jgi:ankyrin repeat protein
LLQILKIYIYSFSGAKVDESNYCGLSPLHLAASAGNLEIAKWLIAHGADCTLKNTSGKTAMQLAQAGGTWN